MKLQLELCQIYDIERLISISRTTFIDAFEEQNDPEDFSTYINKAFSKETLTCELLHPQAHFYFVMLGSTTVGYIKLNDEDAQTDIRDKNAMELERIYVVTQYQGKGFGSWMLEQAKQLAKKANKHYLWLGVWEKNTSAIAFYEAHGCIKFDMHPYYIGKDKQMDWLMRLDLSIL
jgi:ribosomal protein S18 acetylase RimI-like enzyme